MGEDVRRERDAAEPQRGRGREPHGDRRDAPDALAARREEIEDVRETEQRDDGASRRPGAE
jgi:hypothetical protein